MYKSKLLLLDIFIATLFLSIGYSAINPIIMEVNGIVQAEVQDGVFISDVVYLSDIDADLENSTINHYYQSTLDSTISLSNINPLSEITYQITMHNNSDKEQIFQGITYVEELYDNENITYALNGLNTNDIIEPHSQLTFTITFKYLSSSITNDTLNSYINFNFDNIYNISYVNITGNYPNTVYENGEITIQFDEPIPTDITIEGTCNHTYQNGILTITNITSDLIITGITTTDPNNFIITDFNGEINVGNIDETTGTTVNDILTLTFTGNNQSNEIITRIDVMIDYSTSKGSNQSINVVLTHNSNNQEKLVTFTGNTTGTTTASFENLNINKNDTFTITNVENKLTNRGIDITAIRIKVYTT